ncbi:MAG: alpha/beta fold hydrolase [Sulfurifustis sp.]
MSIESERSADAAQGATPRSCYLRCMEREIHYVEWGREEAPPVLMCHGLARTGRDFDDLAAALSHEYRVVCPDMIGRGLSQWSPLPDKEYCLDFYAAIVQALMDQLGLERVRWVGTSMGGAIGMRAAATILKGRITHLVLNDIGATVRSTPGAARIATYVAAPPAFDTMTELENFMRSTYTSYGRQSDLHWRRMAETSARRLPNGKITTHYDPAIVRQYVMYPNDYQQWDYYDRIDTPVLLLRGAESDLLLADVAQEMTSRGPRAQLIEVPGCGHAPPLHVPEQIAWVRTFLAQSSR